jgi:hypothetical protein
VKLTDPINGCTYGDVQRTGALYLTKEQKVMVPPFMLGAIVGAGGNMAVRI